MLILLYGETGCGKSECAGSFKDSGDTIIYDMENRLAEWDYDKETFLPTNIKRNVTFSDYTNLTLIPLKRINKSYKEDKIASFDAFVEQVNKTIHSKPPNVLVVDGISDFRDFAHDKWCKENNRKGAVNPGDWMRVNELVRKELFTLINWSKITGVDIIFTSKMHDNYQKIKKIDGSEDSVKDGRVPDHKDWFDFEVDLTLELWKPKDKNKKPLRQWMATCVKSVRKTNFETRDITNQSLYLVLLDEGLVS